MWSKFRKMTIKVKNKVVRNNQIIGNKAAKNRNKLPEVILIMKC